MSWGEWWFRPRWPRMTRNTQIDEIGKRIRKGNIMKLVSIKCPSCNAPLEVNEELKTCTCNYCGMQIFVDDEINRSKIIDGEALGRELERGRLREQDEGADSSLVDNIRGLIRVLCDLPECRENVVNVKSMLSYNQKKNIFYSSGVVKYSPFALGVLAVIWGISHMVKNQFSFSGVVAMILMATSLTVVGLISIEYKRFTFSKKEADCAEDMRNLLSAIHNIEKEVDRYDSSIIPNKYRTRDALTFFVEAFEDKRALNLTQAINLYEDVCYKNEKLRMQKAQLDAQKEQIRLQREQLQVSRTGVYNQEEQIRLAQESNDLQRKRKKDVFWGNLGASVVKGIIKNFFDI